MANNIVFENLVLLLKVVVVNSLDWLNTSCSEVDMPLKKQNKTKRVQGME